MWSKVERYVEKHNLLNTNSLYIVALSGGADSVALLLWMHEQGYQVHAAHCNFHLRGAESDRDETFCIECCQQFNIPLHRVHFDTQTYAELHRVSIEMAARELRYSWFEKLRQDIGAAAICVAHHRDDSVETVLLNLVRGTGLRGLSGIQPRNGYILRPLLGVSREETEEFLKNKGQAFVTDSTNLETDVLRNKVRLQVLPLLKTLNPGVMQNIQRTAENLSEAQGILDAIVEKYKDCKELEIKELDKYGSREYIIFEWLKNCGFNGAQVRQLLEAETGKVFTSPKGFDALVDRGRILVEPTLEELKPLKVPEEGRYLWGVNRVFTVRKSPVYVSKVPYLATVDAQHIVFPLLVRRVEAGDWMIPYGMKGRKLLSDLMTDRKMSLFEKRRQLVVVDAEDKVLWAVGLRVDARVVVTSQTTEVLTMELSDEK